MCIRDRPTPSWIGLKNAARQPTACVLAHLETRRRSVNPTTMGRIPPDFLFKAISRPPKKIEATSTGHCPAITKLTKPVSAVKNPNQIHDTESGLLDAEGADRRGRQRSLPGMTSLPFLHLTPQLTEESTAIGR